MTKILLVLFWLLALQLCVLAPSFADELCPNGCGVCRKPEGCGPAKDKSKCDQAALDKARAEYKKWMSVYKDLADNADSLWDSASEAADEANELANEELGPKALSINIGKDVTNHVLAEKVAAGAGGEHFAHAVGETLAVVSIAKFLMDLGIVDAKMLSLIKQLDKYAAEASKASDAAYKALQKAHAAYDQVEQLEKQCAGSAKPGSNTGSNDGDDWKSSGQQAEEAARKILDSWKKVQGGYEDADGAFYDTEYARQRALQIVQGQDDSRNSLETGWMSAIADVFAESAYARAEASGTKLSPSRLQQFVKIMGPGFDSLARAVRDCDRARAELKKIGELKTQQTVPPLQEGKPSTKGKEKPQPDVATKGVGHLVPTFPADVNVSNTLIRAYTPGGTKAIQTGIGEQALSLPPGTYDVEVSKLRVVGVAIQGGQETKLRVGVLRVTADSQTTYEVLEPTEGGKLAGGFGNQNIGLPVGDYHLRIRGKVQPITIEEGKITDIR